MERRQPDTAKLQSLLAWEQEYSMDEIIDDVIAYYRPLVAV